MSRFLLVQSTLVFIQGGLLFGARPEKGFIRWIKLL
jgi:hypothetical protein